MSIEVSWPGPFPSPGAVARRGSGTVQDLYQADGQIRYCDHPNEDEYTAFPGSHWWHHYSLQPSRKSGWGY